MTEPLIIVSPARITVGRLETLRLNDTYANAPEPPPSPEFGGIRTSPANLLYLHTLFPTAVWHDPHNRLVEARAYRFIARLRQEEPGEYERNFPFKLPPKDYQLKLFTHARRMTNIALSPVALGCVDANTEYLTPTGWKRISEYDGGAVAQYWPETQTIDFVQSPEYVKLPCPEMIRFRTTRGVDQLLSPEHRVLLAGGEVVTAEFIEQYWPILAYDKVKFRTTFKVTREGVTMSDALLRLQIAVNADGYIHRSDTHPNYKNTCLIRVKKDRKKERLRMLLADAGVDYTERPVQPEGFTTFSFSAPRAKGFDSWWWDCSQQQLEIVADEVTYWDGSFRKAEGLSFYTVKQEDADFIQYAYSATGRRSSINKQDRRREGRSSIDWRVHASSRPPEAGLFGQSKGGGLHSNISREPSPDGYKYCFMVPSTFLLLRRNGCIFATGNTGKSKMTIDIAADKFLRDEIDILIVIAPNGVHRQWINTAIPTHLPESVKWVGAVWKPTRKTPKEIMEAPRVRKLRVLTFNVESLSAEGGKAAKELRKLMATGRAMLVMDESSRIKNPRAQRTKAIVKLRALAAVRVILTGTPVTKGMEDFYTQYEFLDPAIIGMTNYYAFRNRYCVMMPAYRGAGVGAIKITGYKNQEELIRKIAPVSFMIGPEVLGLREPRYERFEVEPTAEQTQIYRMLKEMLIEDLRDKKIVTPANAAVRILRMQQVLCGRYYERVEVEGEEEVYAQEPRIIPSNRPEALLALLEQHDGQAVIWARFKEDIDDIVAAAGTVGRVTIYDGRTDDREREHAVESFKRGDIDYFVANPAAGGTGVDGLQVCQNAFYYSNSYNAEHRWQSEGRTYRLGQQGSPLYVDLVVPNSVDTMILDNLKAKRDLGKAIMDNPAMLNGGL